MIPALSHISQMAPYALANMIPPDGKPLISLAQNECLRPPSPLVSEAITSVLINGAHYPDPDWTVLRHELASLHDVPSDSILCGSGSLDLIGCLARVFAGPKRSVLAPEHAYPFFRTAAQMANARFVTAREDNAAVSVDALLESVHPDTGLVFVANPGNPTGTRVPSADLTRLRDRLRDDILLVIDEAYGEFADHLDEACFDMVKEGTTVVLRTFSKAYGMAGFRTGWGCFPPGIASEMRKVINPNNVSSVSQAAATAAAQDQDYMRETCKLTIQLRDQTSVRLRDAGFKVLPSHTNFLLIDLESSKAAKDADTALRSEGIFLRPQSGAGLPHALRMTIGPEPDVDAAVARLMDWKTEAAR